jgi:hypothetical protein
MMSDFPGAIPYYVDRSRVFPNQNDHKSIVLHGTGGSASQTVEQLGDFFRTTPSMACTHYGIGRDGRIAQYCLEQDGAAGNGILEAGHDQFWNQYADNPNWHSLSVETINDSSNGLPLSDPQKQTLFKLVAYWVKKYNIPLSNIKGHFTLQPVNRVHCPGPNFDWDALWAYLKGGTQPMAIDINTPGVSDYFEGSGDIWKCKRNGFLVGHGILGFYQKFGGNGLCGLTHLGLPTTNETVVLNKAGTTIGVVYQRFERGTLAYDPRHQVDAPPYAGDVYLLHIDSGIGQDPRIAKLQAQLADLQKQLDTNTQAQQIISLEAKIALAVKDLQL